MQKRQFKTVEEYDTAIKEANTMIGVVPFSMKKSFSDDSKKLTKECAALVKEMEAAN